MKPDPQLIDELYHKQRKNFPNELPFPERFNLKLTEDSFNKGIIRQKKKEIQKIVDWKGNLIREVPNTIIQYQRGSRLDKAIEDSFPKAFHPLNVVYSELYDNIQIGTENDKLDLKYNFFLNSADNAVKSNLINYDTIKHFSMRPPDAQKENLRVRIQYAERIVNSAGPRWDCYGYIYIPKRKGQPYEPNLPILRSLRTS